MTPRWEKVWCANSGSRWHNGVKSAGQRRTCSRCKRSVKITRTGAIAYHYPPWQMTR